MNVRSIGRTFTPLVAAQLIVSLSLATASAAEPLRFSRDIRPLLSNACFHCHGPDAKHREAELRLDVESGVLAAFGKEGAALRRITSDDPDTQMPPPDSHKSLTADQIKLIKKWVEQGGKYEPHWSFIPPSRPQLPAVQKSSWPKHEIDRFVLARLEANGLSPSPPARPRTLARRLFLDLTGLPPLPADVDAYVKACEETGQQAATENLVDQLLASEAFGERMAVPWLDAARYADTNGFSIDDHREQWAWRDWVIDAFNRNLPYDQFITQQLAGDLLPDATVKQKVATGFLRNSMSTHEGGTLPEEYRVIYLADKVDMVSTALLGLTLRCGQCHDHKYDPFSQQEYYRFFAYFDRAIEHGYGGQKKNIPPAIDVAPLLGNSGRMKQRLERRIQLLERYKERLQDQSTATKNAELSQLFTPSQIKNGIALKTVEREINALLKAVASGKTSTMIMQEQPKPKPTYLLIRGAYDQPDTSQSLLPGTPTALPTWADDLPANRLGLARWLTHPRHPLTARVAVNRYWQMLFGRGLVETPNDFGSQGKPPSHPDLLDWLAREFVDHGWDTKRLIKLIVLSATYQQTSDATPERVQRDPANRLLGRAGRFRLPAEFVRDNALAVSGLLVREVGGPSVYPPQPIGLWREVSHYGHFNPFTAQVFVPDEGEDLRRRSLYTFWKRTSPPPAMSALDAPTREVCTVQRSRTNTPLQALVLLNDPQFVDAARSLAAVTLKTVLAKQPVSKPTTGGESAQKDPRAAGPRSGALAERRLRFAFRRATLRPPTQAESEILLRRLRTARDLFTKSPDTAAKLVAANSFAPPPDLDVTEFAAWTVVCNVILNLDETITRE